MSNNAEKTTIVTEDDDEPDDWLVGLQLALLSQLTMGVGISASSALAATVSLLGIHRNAVLIRSSRAGQDE
jgi:galactokinase